MNKLTDSQQEAIDDIIDNFDFDKVYEAMSALSWFWYQPDEAYRVPTVYELRKKARGLLKEVVLSSSLDISTGGFDVTKEIIDGEVNLKLSFVLEQEDCTFSI